MVSEPGTLSMATNKERVKTLDTKVSELHHSMSQVEDKIQRMSETLMILEYTQPGNFPKFGVGDPSKWFNRVHQYLEFQNVP